jgi:hypothetical protein
LPGGADSEAEFVKLLGQAGQRYRAIETVDSAVKAKAPVAAYTHSAIATLARVLAGPQQLRYRVDSSSKQGAFYALEVIGNDITCSCKGFSYRGACQHARTLKQVLVQQEDLPEGFSKIEV